MIYNILSLLSWIGFSAIIPLKIIDWFYYNRKQDGPIFNFLQDYGLVLGGVFWVAVLTAVFFMCSGPTFAMTLTGYVAITFACWYHAYHS